MAPLAQRRLPEDLSLSVKSVYSGSASWRTKCYVIIDGGDKMLYNVCCMLRTQIYLPEDLLLELKFLSQKEDKPTARVIRELLRDSVRRIKKKKNAGDLLLKLAKLGARGPTDLSKNFYEYAYGKKSSYAKRK